MRSRVMAFPAASRRIWRPSMYFLALSQAPPVLDMEMAIWTPAMSDPGSIPARHSFPKRIPHTMGDRITSTPGGIISLSDPSVAMRTHSAWFFFPRLELALDLVHHGHGRLVHRLHGHLALNQHGSIPPTSSPGKTFESMMFTTPILACVMNAAYSAIPTKAADEIANPFPIAAVVFPAASRLSVQSRTGCSSPSPSSSLISTIPPALSEIGPYARSSAPRHRRQDPQRRHRDPVHQRQVDRHVHRRRPSRRSGRSPTRTRPPGPPMMFVAAPVVHASASSFTGRLGVARVVLRRQPDHQPAPQPRDHAQVHLPVVHRVRPRPVHQVRHLHVPPEAVLRHGGQRRRRQHREITSWYFSAGSMSSFFPPRTGSPAGRTAPSPGTPESPSPSPSAGTSASPTPPRPSAGDAYAPSTSAAHVASPNDPNRSLPIPAMSPTLSPMQSAITPGFSGESSGSPFTTFPTRSAPTSAAFVKIPPPTRPKHAIDDPPSPNAAMHSYSRIFASCDESPRIALNTRIVRYRFSSPSDTSENPITIPPWNAVVNAPCTLRPVLPPPSSRTTAPTPHAVRLFVYVAIRIPMYPPPRCSSGTPPRRRSPRTPPFSHAFSEIDTSCTPA
eukprot:Sspe_Gene.3436::Locus_1139_Transcript_1_2_Confidence_0.500_Length_2201::g.3436::m.3436